MKKGRVKLYTNKQIAPNLKWDRETARSLWFLSGLFLFCGLTSLYGHGLKGWVVWLLVASVAFCPAVHFWIGQTLINKGFLRLADITKKACLFGAIAILVLPVRAALFSRVVDTSSVSTPLSQTTTTQTNYEETLNTLKTRLNNEPGKYECEEQSLNLTTCVYSEAGKEIIFYVSEDGLTYEELP